MCFDWEILFRKVFTYIIFYVVFAVAVDTDSVFLLSAKWRKAEIHIKLI